METVKFTTASARMQFPFLTSKRGMMKNKRGVSKLIEIILLILLAIVIILLLYNVITKMIKENAEVEEVKAGLFTENMDITRVDGEITAPPQVNITIKRWASREVLKNVTVIKPIADIVFLVDTTGTMAFNIASASNAITGFIEKLEERGSGVDPIDYRLSLVEFRDYPGGGCGDYTDFPSKIHHFPEGSLANFTTDVGAFKSELSQLSSNVGGGGDNPESHLTAINNATDLGFREDAKKVFILLSDAMPHAKDCLYSGSSSTYYSCYKGPENVDDVTKKLAENQIIFYYVHSPLGECLNGVIENDMTSKTGGKSYRFSNPEEIKGIIDILATEIRKKYEAELSYYLKVVFYNDTATYSYNIYNPPKPLETIKYTIVTNDETIHHISNINKIEIYPVIKTDSGRLVIGQAFDVWTKPSG
jgi:hypothetical protein